MKTEEMQGQRLDPAAAAAVEISVVRNAALCPVEWIIRQKEWMMIAESFPEGDTVAMLSRFNSYFAIFPEALRPQHTAPI
jgi:hypothetical protein